MAASEVEIESVLAAMADPTRRHILELLATGEHGLSATAVSDSLPVSRQAIVKHLSVLDQAGLVTARRSGREVRFAVKPAGLVSAGQWLVDLGAGWAPAAGPTSPPTEPTPPASAPPVAAAPTPPASALPPRVPPPRVSPAAPTTPQLEDAVAHVVGQVADRLYRLVPRPFTRLVPPILRR